MITESLKWRTEKLFRRDVHQLGSLILRNLRQQGLETPLLQRRLMGAWPSVAGQAVASHTRSLNIVNQTLFVKIDVPALRADLSMRRSEFVTRLNASVESQVISDVCFF